MCEDVDQAINRLKVVHCTFATHSYSVSCVTPVRRAGAIRALDGASEE